MCDGVFALMLMAERVYSRICRPVGHDCVKENVYEG